MQWSLSLCLVCPPAPARATGAGLGTGASSTLIILKKKNPIKVQVAPRDVRTRPQIEDRRGSGARRTPRDDGGCHGDARGGVDQNDNDKLRETRGRKARVSERHARVSSARV